MKLELFFSRKPFSVKVLIIILYVVLKEFFTLCDPQFFIQNANVWILCLTFTYFVTMTFHYFQTDCFVEIWKRNFFWILSTSIDFSNGCIFEFSVEFLYIQYTLPHIFVVWIFFYSDFAWKYVRDSSKPSFDAIIRNLGRSEQKNRVLSFHHFWTSAVTAFLTTIFAACEIFLVAFIIYGRHWRGC